MKSAFAISLAFIALAVACGDDDTTTPAPGGGTSSSSSSSGATSSSSSSSSSSSGSTANGLTGDGITGTFGGKAHTHLVKPTNVPQQTSTVVLEAVSVDPPPTDQWRIRMKPQLGSQSCTAGTGTEDTFVQFGSQTDFNASGTTASGGKCTIDVTSVDPKFEGTFTATLVTLGGQVEVTAGAFRVAK